MNGTLRVFSPVVGVVLLLVGMLGFVPGVTTGEGLLFGLFAL